MLDKMMSQDSWIKSDQYLDRLDWLLGIVSHDWALQVCKHKVLKSWDILIIWIEDGKLLILPLTLQHRFHSDRNRRLIHSCSLNLGLAARGCEKCGARTRSCAEGLASVVLLLQDSRHSSPPQFFLTKSKLFDCSCATAQGQVLLFHSALSTSP